MPQVCLRLSLAVLGPECLTGTLLDRLTQHAQILKMNLDN